MKPEQIVIEHGVSEYEPTTDKLTAEEAEKHHFVASFDKATAQGRENLIESLMNGTTKGANYIVAVVIPSELSEEERSKLSEEELKNISHVKKAVLLTAGTPLGVYSLVEKIKEQIVAKTPQLDMLEKLNILKAMAGNGMRSFDMLSAMGVLSDFMSNNTDKEPAEKTGE